MSENNVWIGKEHNGKFYGWDFSGHLPKDGTPIKFIGGNSEDIHQD